MIKRIIPDRKTLWMLLLVAVSGPVSYLSLPPEPVPYLAFLLPVILAAVAHRTARSWKRSLVAGLLLGLAAATAGFYWMLEAMTHFAPVPLWAASIEFLFFSLLSFWKYPLAVTGFALLLRLHAGLSRSLGFAMIATLAELITPHLFEWRWGFLIASENRLAQLASVAGVSGLTFVQFFIGYHIYRLTRFLPFLKSGRTIGRALGRIPLLRMSAPFLLVAICLYIGARLEERTVLAEHAAARANVAMLQTNTPPAPSIPGYAFTADQLRNLFHRDIPMLLQELDLAAMGERLDLIVMPESAVPYYSTERNEFTEREGDVIYAPVFQSLVKTVATRYGAPLLFNEDVRGPSPVANYSLYNAATLITAEGAREQSYQKRRLAPGEQNPLRMVFEQLGLSSMLPDGLMAGRYSAGEQAELIRYGNGPGTGRLLPLICSEALISRHPAEFGNEYDFMVNLVQERWYGPAERHLHLEAARMRAIEYGRSLVRVANGGISAVIAPSGRFVTSATGETHTAINAPGVMIVEVPILSNATPFARFGHAWLILPSLMIFAALFVRRFRRRYAMTARLAGAEV